MQVISIINNLTPIDRILTWVIPLAAALDSLTITYKDTYLDISFHPYKSTIRWVPVPSEGVNTLPNIVMWEHSGVWVIS